MKEVTVVIPNYNGMKYLPECMASLCQGQENAPEYEVLIIDNGSADGSVEYLDSEWCRKKEAPAEEGGKPQVRLIALPENTGFCHAVNLGIREARSSYVILLNNDTRVEAGFVKGLYDAIRKDEKIFSVSAKMLMWDKPELLDDAGDRYCVLGWAYSREKAGLLWIMTRMSAYSQPVAERQFTDVRYLRRSAILTKRILLIWKIWISVTVPGSTAMRTGTSRRHPFCITAVLLRDPATIPGKRNFLLPIISMSSAKICRYYSGS